MPETMVQSHAIAGDRPGKHLLITAGVHGDEFAPMEAVRRLMTRIAPAELTGRVTLVPVVNEAAFERGQRIASDGLDLARTCPGRSDGSITERVAAALSRLIQSADFYIDLHTGGALLSLVPMTGYFLHRNPDVLAAQRMMAEAFNVPVIWGSDPRLEGRSLSVARDADAPAIYVEYGGGAVWDESASGVLTEGCLNVLGVLEMLDRRSPASHVRYRREDDRPGSGHLQVCHPAPCAGMFAPAVTLGQRVVQGQTLGWIDDVLGTPRAEVPASQTGMVLGLRCFPRVSAGESLAIVVDFDDVCAAGEQR